MKNTLLTPETIQTSQEELKKLEEAFDASVDKLERARHKRKTAEARRKAQRETAAGNDARLLSLRAAALGAAQKEASETNTDRLFNLRAAALAVRTSPVVAAAWDPSPQAPTTHQDPLTSALSSHREIAAAFALNVGGSTASSAQQAQNDSEVMALLRGRDALEQSRKRPAVDLNNLPAANPPLGQADIMGRNALLSSLLRRSPGSVDTATSQLSNTMQVDLRRRMLLDQLSVLDQGRQALTAQLPVIAEHRLGAASTNRGLSSLNPSATLEAASINRVLTSLSPSTSVDQYGLSALAGLSTRTSLDPRTLPANSQRQPPTMPNVGGLAYPSGVSLGLPGVASYSQTPLAQPPQPHLDSVVQQMVKYPAPSAFAVPPPKKSRFG